MEPDLVSKEHDEAQELFLPETVELIVHCALERCPGGESNHSSTTLVSFFEFFLATCQKLNVVRVIHSLTGWYVLSNNNSLNIEENDEHCLDRGFFICAFFGLGE
jgi:hypothetical protein